MTRSARTLASLGTLRKARSQIVPGIWSGKAGNGRNGEAFVLVEFGVMDRATANSSPRTPRATNRMTRPPKRSPPQEAARGFWIRACRPTRARSSRNRATRIAQHSGWASSRVGWTIPAIHAKTNSVRIKHPIRTLAYRTLVTCLSNQDLCLSYDSYLLE